MLRVLLLFCSFSLRDHSADEGMEKFFDVVFQSVYVCLQMINIFATIVRANTLDLPVELILNQGLVLEKIVDYLGFLFH